MEMDYTKIRSKNKYTVKNHCFESMKFLIFYLTRFDSKKFTNKVPRSFLLEDKGITNLKTQFLQTLIIKF